MDSKTKALEFAEKISRQQKVEPRDWMPEDYQRQLIRMISQHAHSEIIGMQPEGEWIAKAPSLRRKIALLAKVQDECGHGLYLYSAAETLGTSRDQLSSELRAGKAKYSNIFNYPTLSWADIGMIGWLVDGAAIINQTTLAKGSYGPYARAMIRICKEENFHKKQGMEIVGVLCRGSTEQRAMAQESFNRWWWPTLMMFGPTDSDSPHSQSLLSYKIKVKSNDSLRQRYIDMTVPQAQEFGLTVPDPNLRFNSETEHWEIGAINWQEFYAVIAGDGPCNKLRISHYSKSWEDGAWVREAALAFAEKQAKLASELKQQEAL